MIQIYDLKIKNSLKECFREFFVDKIRYANYFNENLIGILI